MTFGHLHDPDRFIEALRTFHAAQEGSRGRMANELSDAILRKQVDLGIVRQRLVDAGEIELYDELDRFMDLIEPYLSDSGDTE